MAKRVLVVVAYALLPVLLFTFGFLFSLHQVLGNADSIKRALKESGIYEGAVTSLLRQAQQKEADSTNVSTPEELPIEQKEIQDAIDNAFSPQLLESQATGFLDDTYAWVHGDTKNLNFEVDLSQAQANLAARISEYARKRVSELPECPAGTTVTQEFDALSATCKPLGTDANAVADQTKQKILGSEFFDDTTLKASDLKDSQGRSLDQQFSHVPGIYNQVVTAIYILGILVLALAAAAVFGNESRRAGIRRVAIIILTVGGVSTLFAWLSTFVGGRIVRAVTTSGGSDVTIQENAAEAIQWLLTDLRSWWFGVGIFFAVVGFGMLIGLRFFPAGTFDNERHDGRMEPKTQSSMPTDEQGNDQTKTPA